VAQRHLDRLTALDASFLAQEGRNSHMHVGAVAVFEGPRIPFGEVVDHVRSRLHLVPRYRQRLALPPRETGRPLWVDDPHFDVEFHVRQTALPQPGSDEQLMTLTARVFSQALDRDRPLWELWAVEGLASGRFALLSKAHHALIDGISGVDLATVMFDLSPVPPAIPHPDEPWAPQPVPGGAELLARGAAGLAQALAGVAGGALGSLVRPRRALGVLREAVEGVGEVAWATLDPAPATPLNVPIGPHRRVVAVRAQLEDLKLVKNTFGGTVNDVVLTAVAGALRRWLQGRGVRTAGLELRALVPVSTRTADQRGEFGNRVAAMRGPLPVYVEDPVARLRAVRAAMDGLKASKQAVGAEVLAGLEQFAPPTILAQASRLNFSTRLFNLIVTNVPGPQVPLYVRGRELREVLPIAFLPEGHALAVAIFSYDGGVFFGLLADRETIPDLPALGGLLEDALAELVDAARQVAEPAPVLSERP
jgi:WS/DGAT/MGAT family acyltransferase